MGLSGTFLPNDGPTHHFLPSKPNLSQTANQLQLLPSTTFLARAYFDSALTSSDQEVDPLPMFLAALCLAIKVAPFVR